MMAFGFSRWQWFSSLVVVNDLCVALHAVKRGPVKLAAERGQGDHRGMPNRRSIFKRVSRLTATYAQSWSPQQDPRALAIEGAHRFSPFMGRVFLRWG